MTDKNQTSAYVDKQLTKDEVKTFENEMLNDPSLLDEVAQYAELKDKIKLGYKNEHSSHYKEFNSCERRGSFIGNCKQAVAAVVVLAFGLFIFKSTSNTALVTQSIEVAQLENAPDGFKLKPIKFDQNKLLLHISSSDEKTLEKAIFQAESLLTQYENNDIPLQLEVIANSGGIDLMRASVSPYAQKIKELQNKYKQVEFVACINTLKRLSRNGEDTTLLPGVTADLPVVDKIIGRIQSGWTYVKI